MQQRIIFSVLKMRYMRALAAVFATVAVLCAAVVPTSVAWARAEAKTTIVLDAGHGGADGGVYGRVSGVKESDINLAVTLALEQYLEGAGFRVVLTRKNSGGAGNFNLRKREDMETRARIIQRAEPKVTVSVHCNYFNQYHRRGAQVFFDAKNEGSAAFATIMQEVLNDDINDEQSGRRYEAQGAEKYILECNSAPSLIVECGFLSNAEDEKLLSNADYRMKIAHVIFKGIVIYLSK